MISSSTRACTNSSGNAVLEALSFGLPVVCLDLGGPAQIVTPDAGAIVSTAGRDTTQLAAAMAAEILRITALSGTAQGAFRWRGRQSSTVCIGGPRGAVLRDGGMGGFERRLVGKILAV